MSLTHHKDANEQVHRLLSQLRAEFDGLRARETPVQARLIHRATNAEAEGVKGSPSRMVGSVGGIFRAGQRDGWPNLDANGNQEFVDRPLLDPAGTPIVNSAGQGVDWTMPASRTIEFSGDRGAVTRLRTLAERGGQLAVGCRVAIHGARGSMVGASLRAGMVRSSPTLDGEATALADR